jgi:hypothetical protein
MDWILAGLSVFINGFVGMESYEIPEIRLMLLH